jgi:hypothetical protein
LYGIDTSAATTDADGTSVDDDDVVHVVGDDEIILDSFVLLASSLVVGTVD